MRASVGVPTMRLSRLRANISTRKLFNNAVFGPSSGDGRASEARYREPFDVLFFAAVRIRR